MEELQAPTGSGSQARLPSSRPCPLEQLRLRPGIPPQQSGLDKLKPPPVNGRQAQPPNSRPRGPGSATSPVHRPHRSLTVAQQRAHSGHNRDKGSLPPACLAALQGHTSRKALGPPESNSLLPSGAPRSPGTA